MKKPMRWIVTGCHGFLGASFSEYAAADGHEVLGIARSSQPPLAFKGRYLSADVAVSELAADFREFRPDAILHAAGSASVAASFKSPHDDFRASLAAWSNVLDAIRRSETQPIVFFPSSAAVYGQPESLPVSETAAPNPMSPYGYHKYGGEILAESYARFFGARIVLLRLFSVFGPRQRKLLLWDIYRQIRNATASIELSGTGREARDFLHIGDLSSAILELAQLKIEPGDRLLLNIGRGEERTVLSIANALLHAGGLTLPVWCKGEARIGDPDRWVADIGRLRSLIPNWAPKPLEQSLAETVLAWSQQAA